MRSLAWTLIGGWALWLGGCGEKVDPIVGGSADLGAAVYCEAISTIMEASCTSCHASTLSVGDRRGAPPTVDLDSYDLAVESATDANERIQDGTMPPGGGLPENEKQLFQEWLDASTPEGCSEQGG